MKGIFRRGQKYWYRFTLHGKQVRMPLDTEDESEAIRRAWDLRSNPTLLPTEPIRAELKSYAEGQFRLNHFTERTRDEVIRTLNGFFDYSAIASAQAITTGEIQRWYNWLKTPRTLIVNGVPRLQDALTEESAQTYVARLSGFLRHLIESRKLRRNPVEDVKMAKLIPRPRRVYCRNVECDQLIENCGREDLRFILYAGFHAGLRKGEIIEARGEWFDLAEGVLHIPVTEYWHPKGKASRDVPLTEAFMKFLSESDYFKHSLASKVDYMLEPKVVRGKSRYRWDFRRPFEEYMESQGMRWVTTHVTRKTFGSLLASAGVSFLKISAWLGDDIRTTINNYAYLQPRDRDIERAFSGKPIHDHSENEAIERLLVGNGSGKKSKPSKGKAGRKTTKHPRKLLTG
jgi:integrase